MAGPGKSQATYANPAISVILTIHDRLEFAQFAFDSILAQDVDPELCEIIIVTNIPRFSDPTVISNNQGLGKWNVRVILADQSTGSFLLPAILSARGHILAMIDDDDVWHPSRLRRVLNAFKGRESLGYFHNAQLQIDKLGRPHPTGVGISKLVRHPGNVSGNAQLVYVTHSEAIGHTQVLGRFEADFNLSSICILRDIVMRSVPIFRVASKFEDGLLFYLALASGCDLCLTDEPLTLYRVHSQNISAPTDGAPEHVLGKSLALLEENLRTIALIQGLASREGKNDIQLLLDYHRVYITLLGLIQSLTAGRRELFSAVNAFLKLSGQMNRRRNSILLLAGLVSLASPAVSRHAFVLGRQHF